jgi:hypothetical protein
LGTLLLWGSAPLLALAQNSITIFASPFPWSLEKCKDDLFGSPEIWSYDVTRTLPQPRKNQSVFRCMVKGLICRGQYNTSGYFWQMIMHLYVKV